MKQIIILSATLGLLAAAAQAQTGPDILGVDVSPTNNALAVETVTFTGNVTGSGLTYQWLSDVGHPGTLTAISGATGSTLIVNGAGVSTSNNYQLFVTNSFGQSNSSVIPLVFAGPPPQGILWGTPTTISGDPDVSTNGVGLVAAEANTNSSITVNGVTFNQFLPIDYYTHPENDDYGSPFAVDGITNGNGSVTLSDADGAVYYWDYGDFPGFGATNAPFSDLSPNYQAVVASGIGGLGNDNTLVLFFTNLHPGAVYGLQLWDNDSRSCCAFRSATVSDLFGNAITLSYNTLDAMGGTGEYVIGEAQADANGTLTATINAPGYQQLNAFQLRSPSHFPPYLTPIFVAPTNTIYEFSGVAITITEAAANPVGSSPGYQWQWDQGLGGGFSALTGNGANTQTLSLPTNLAVGTYKYEVVVTNLYGQSTTAPVTVSVLPVGPPVLTSQSPSSIAAYSISGPVTLSYSAIGLQPLTYQWVLVNANGVLTPIGGATTNSLVVNPSTLTPYGTYTYELIVSNSLATVTSAPITLTVAGIPQPRPEGFFWGPSVAATEDADVAINGSGVVAYGAAPTAVTLNGVTFDVFVPSDVTPTPGGFVQSGQTDISSNSGPVTTTLSLGIGGTLFWYDGFSQSIAPFSTLSKNYQSLLGAGDGDFGNDPWTLAFSGLNPGSEYELQLWVNDSRGNGIDRVGVLSDGTLQSAPMPFNNQENGGGIGSFIIGTALADTNGDLELFVDGSQSTQVNAFQLRQLPPTTGKPVINPPQPQTAAQYVGQDGPVTFTSAAGGTGPLSYQWIRRTGPNTFTNVPTATTNSLTINTAGLAPAAYEYYLVVSNASGATTSSVASLVIAGIPVTPASGINWGPVAPVVGDADVRTDGAGVLALDAAPYAVTLNGVAFGTFVPSDVTPLPGAFEQSAQTDITTNFGAVTATLTIGAQGSMFWYDGFGSVDPPFTTYSTNYENLLAAANADDGASTDAWTLAFTGLSPNSAYELQLWVNDSRAYGLARFDTLSLGGATSGPVIYNTLEFPGGGGSFVVGTALSDNTGAITLSVQGNMSTEINAFQLRALLSSSISITRNGSNLVVTWTGSGGILQESPSPQGPWTSLTSATSPYTVAAAGAAEFFRVKLP